jgi:hypothetical protein
MKQPATQLVTLGCSKKNQQTANSEKGHHSGWKNSKGLVSFGTKILLSIFKS